MDFQVYGDVMQAVVVSLTQGERLRAEAGAMLYMTGGIEMETRMHGGLMGGLKRVLTGESLFIPHFSCAAPRGQVAFASPVPGKVRQVDLSHGGASWLCQRDSFLCATDGVEMAIAFTKKIAAGLFGGEGFVLQRLSGSGVAFINAGGNFLEFNLGAADSLKVDTGCLVGFEETVSYDIRFMGGFKNTLFGGEGLFLTHLTGPGRLILQTMPFSRLAGRITGAGAEGSGSMGGLGGTLRDVGNIFGGGD